LSVASGRLTTGYRDDLEAIFQMRTLGSESRWVVGVDLGQKQDYSAVAALEVLDAVHDRRDPITQAFAQERSYRLRGWRAAGHFVPGWRSMNGGTYEELRS
jgi:hypothetical protein